MTNHEFDAMVRLMRAIAYEATGQATHQRRAGDINDDIEEARAALVPEDGAAVCW